MATALRQHLSIDSYWDGPEVKTFPDRTSPVHNVKGEYCSGGAPYRCTMWEGLKKSLNTMYYEIGEFNDPKAKISMTPAKIIDMAGQLGVQNLWPAQTCGGGARQPLTGSNGDQLIKQHCFSPEVAFGQYGIALQDLANVMATYAADGLRSTEHFVDSVTAGTGKDATVKYKSSWAVTKVAVPGMVTAQWADLQWAMQQVYHNAGMQDKQLANGREAAAKTGTWELSPTSNDNGWVVFNGYTARRQ